MQDRLKALRESAVGRHEAVELIPPCFGAGPGDETVEVVSPCVGDQSDALCLLLALVLFRDRVVVDLCVLLWSEAINMAMY